MGSRCLASLYKYATSFSLEILFPPIPYLDVIMNLYSIRSICNRHK